MNPVRDKVLSASGAPTARVSNGMKRVLLTALTALLILLGAYLPTGMARAAINAPSSFSVANDLLATSSAPGNAYTVGGSVVITAPTQGDLTAIGGSVVVAGPVAGDVLLLAGSISTRALFKGDLRVAGWNVKIAESVSGDLVAIGYTVTDDGRAEGSVFIVAANASVTAGAAGPVTIYANNVFLAGDFAGDVRVTASGAVTLAEGTTIRGKLVYEAPDTARVPTTATIVGGTEYINASYLPNVGTSRTLALASIGIFLLVRIIGALILAGLLAGLFPGLAELMVERITHGSVRSTLLTTLLGFAVVVATPILLILLSITFVGLGLAVLLGISYALLMVLSFMYAGISLGALGVRRFLGREQVLWHDGVLGMLALSLVALVPFVGWLIVFLFMAFAAGTLLALFFKAVFPNN